MGPDCSSLPQDANCNGWHKAHKVHLGAEAAVWLSGHSLHERSVVGTDGNLLVGIK